MVSVVDVTLNVAAGVMITVLIATSVNPDWMRLVSIVYGALFIVMVLVPDGGQVNVAMAMGLFAYVLLRMMGSGKSIPGNTVKQREKVVIFSGIMTAKTNIGRTFNTYDPTSPSYKRLSRSINRMGGAQFSYSFWIMFERGVSDEAVAGKTIFMRGDSRQFKPMKSTADLKDTPDSYYFEGGSDYTIACPRVSFVTANQLAVDINTDRDLRKRFLVGSKDTVVEMRKNAISLVPGHFALMTFVFEDNVGIDSFERGVRMRFYLNDKLYHTSTTPGAIRQNDGPLHMFLDKSPDGREGIDNCRVADLTYYNYALDDGDVASIYGNGYVNKEAQTMYGVLDKDIRLVMGSRNRIDFGANYDDRMAIGK